MATTLRFVLLGDDRASQAFSRFARQVDQANRSVDRSNVALRRQAATSDSLGVALGRLTGHVTGAGDAFGAANGKASIFARVIAGAGAATGILEPIVSSTVVVVGALAASLGVAAAGLGAYGAALAPLLQQAGVATKAQQTLDTARARAQAQYTASLNAGAAPAAAAAARARTLQAAQSAYNAAVRQTPGPVREFARSLTAAHDTYKAWADSLAAPVLRPLNIALGDLKPLLAAISPLVRAAAGALTTLVTELSVPIHGGGLTQMVQTILPHVQPVILNLGHAIENVIAGFGGILGAFLPFTGTVTGGLDRLTLKFREWATTLSGHSGFHAVVAQWRADWPVIRPVLDNLLGIFKNIVSDLAGMATPANSRALWQIANPLTALALTLSTHPALITALTYLVLVGKGGQQIKGVFDAMKTGWGTLSSVLNKLTGGRIGTGMQTAGDTMLAASRNMQRAADTMAAATGRGAAGAAGAGGAEGAAAGAASRGGLLGALLGRLGTIGLPLFAAQHVTLPGMKMPVLQFDIQSFQRSFVNPLVHAWDAVAPRLGSAFTPGGALNQAMLRGWDRMVHGLTSAIGSAFTPGGALNQSMLRGGGRLIGSFTGGMQGAYRATASWLGGLKGRITGTVGDTGRWLLSRGQDLIGGLYAGIRGIWRTVSGWLGGMPARTQAYWHGSTGWLVRGGQNVINGLYAGIRAGWRIVSGWFGGLPGRFSAFFRGSLSWLFHGGQDVIQGLYNGILSIWHRVTSFITGIPGWIKAHKGPLSLDQGLLVPAGRAIMSGLHLGLLSGAGGPFGFISGIAGTIGDLLSKGINGLFGGGAPGGGGVGRWAPTVLRVLGLLGLPSSYLSPWLRQIATESGGNERAINLTDINAQRGDPSRGLLQTIMSTFMAYAGPFRSLGIYNGFANTFAAVNYALHRYGRVGMLGVIGHGHGYAAGSFRVPVTGPATVHAGEMILPAGLAEAVRQVLATGGGHRGGGAPVLNVEHLHVTSQADAILLARSATFYWRHAGGLG